MKKLFLLSAPLLNGCLALPIDYTKLNADQIREIAKDKGITVQCAKVNTPYGPGIVAVVSIDRGMPSNSAVTVDEQCKVITSTAQDKK